MYNTDLIIINVVPQKRCLKFISFDGSDERGQKKKTKKTDVIILYFVEHVTLLLLI